MYLRLSVTDACNFRCWYCRPEGPAPEPACGSGLPLDVLLRLTEAIHGAAGLHKVRLTGGEPLLRPDVVDLVARLRALLPEAELTLTTNGARLAPLAEPLRRAGLDRINVSLDRLDAAGFAAITGVDALDRVRAGLAAARAAGFERLKLNAVLQRDLAPEGLEALVRFALDMGAEIRFIELMPFGPAVARHAEVFLPAAEALAWLRAGGGYLGPAPHSDTAERHCVRRGDRKGVVGFIPSVSRPFCGRCDRLRLDARGRLYGCLRRAESVDLAERLASGGAPEVREAVQELVAHKVRPRSQWPVRSMQRIGG